MLTRTDTDRHGHGDHYNTPSALCRGVKTRVFRCHLVSDNPNVNREEMMEHLSAWYCISQNISFGLHEGTLFINILLIQKDKMNPMDTIIVKFECILCS